MDEQTEKEIALGSALRRARNEPGLSLEEIAVLVVQNIGAYDAGVLAREITSEAKNYEDF